MRWCLAAAVACYSPVTLIGDGNAGSGSDGSADGSIVADDAAFCTDGRLGVSECLPGGLIGRVVQAANTDASTPLCEGADKPYCLITGFDVTVSGNAFGSRPLVVIAVHDVTVDAGTILAASSSASQSGPGAGSAQCSFSSPALGAGGGGAGGSFGTAGGHGGGALGGTGGGPALAKPPPTQLEPGCPGQVGSAAGVSGGGVVMLIAGNEIRIAGTLEANGAGGAGGAIGAGGGGGGAGGLVALDAITLDLTGGTLLERGGGGGGGGSTSGAGTNGTGGDAGADTGSGGAGGANGGGNGGNGAANGAIALPGAGTSASGAGGGGGGGGLGYLMYHGSLMFNGSTKLDPSSLHEIP